MRLSAGLLAVLLLLFSSAAYAEVPFVQTRATLGGELYTIAIDLPSQTVGKTYPAIIALHGQIGDGQQMREMSHLNDLAFRQGAIVVFPDANKGLSDDQGSCNAKLNDPLSPLSINCKESLTWGRGRCCEGRLQAETDGVRMIDGLIDLLVRKYKADPTRIYLVGYDEGANQGFRYVCDHPEKIAAYAAIGGVDWYKNCKQTPRPVPILYMHGDADKCAPYNGEGVCGVCRARAEGQRFNEIRWEYQCRPIPDMIGLWAQTNGCGLQKVETQTGSVSCSTWTSCRGGSNLSFCTLKGSGSFWPQGQMGFAECKRAGYTKKCAELLTWLGPVSQDINATETVWSFFKQRQLPAAPR